MSDEEDIKEIFNNAQAKRNYVSNGARKLSGVVGDYDSVKKAEKEDIE